MGIHVIDVFPDDGEKFEDMASGIGVELPC
jgi:hypothetical protein